MKSPDIPLWSPTHEFIRQSNLRRYLDWLKVNKSLEFENYQSLWEWSVKNIASFWESLWQFCNIISHSPYSEILAKPPEGMIDTKWFSGSTLNYAEHILRNKSSKFPAIIFQSERYPMIELSWDELETKVAIVASYLKSVGIRKGDRIASILPNIPETVIAFLATNSIGAIWSSCSPDFGNASVIDRFQQIEAKLLFAVDGYVYNGRVFDKLESLSQLIQSLSTLKEVVVLPYLNKQSKYQGAISWDELMNTHADPLEFEPLSFEHPIWILYSSGTTGKPKAITHSVGGCLLEHLKVLILHQDVKAGERYFWYSTTGWMMWNFSIASLLVGATLVIYEGAAGHPDLEVLWKLAAETRINHFGGGAAFFIACMKAGLTYGDKELPALRSIGSTGSPLPPETFEWIYKSIKSDLWLISFSGGTDICSGFVGGCPLLPVYSGEIQCRLLGCHLEAFDEEGKPVRDQLGEMVILDPMPSMPVFFWNDKNQQRYHASYFDKYRGIWCHGDWIKITNRNSVIIFGRSDATLNRDGVRIGTSEVYSAVDTVSEVNDSLVVCLEQAGGKYFMPLFVVLKENVELDEELKKKIRTILRSQYSPRHVPDEIYQVEEIPYTISGKKMETPVKKILMGMDASKVASKDTMKNPGSLDFFVRFAKSN
jgi:acetoacetyl-CoA synthetase